MRQGLKAICVPIRLGSRGQFKESELGVPRVENIHIVVFCATAPCSLAGG